MLFITAFLYGSLLEKRAVDACFPEREHLYCGGDVNMLEKIRQRLHAAEPLEFLLYVCLAGAVIFFVFYLWKGLYAGYHMLRIFLLFVFLRYAVRRVFQIIRKK